jgi:hypothetical protein
MTADRPATHRVPLGGDDWALWGDVVLRSAGFPAELTLALTDTELAAAADAAVRDPTRLAGYQREYACATVRLSTEVRKVAQLPRFREAVAWQNPKLIKQCLDKIVAGEPRNVRGRNHELTIASYLQRYCLKNDTIGFFGPVGWARWRADLDWLAVDVGDPFLSRRTVNFEAWAIDAVARALLADARLRPWLVPRRLASHRFDGNTLHLPGRAPIVLSPRERELMSHVDGARRLREIVAELIWSDFPELGDEASVFAAYQDLAERGLVRLDFDGTIRSQPERALIGWLERIDDAEVRKSTLDTVARLVAARDRVGAAGGDDVALEAALGDLAGCFEDITGTRGERRPGQTYAGRTLVYEDTVLGTRVGLGAALRAELAGPLRLLLASARWLVAEVGDQFDVVFQELYDRRVAQAGVTEVPLAAILSLATPFLYFDLRSLSEPVRRAVAEFQRRWAEILRLPADAARVRLCSADLADAVAERFATRPAAWATGVHHSPDILLAAAGPEAVARGDFYFVLGELHVSVNTLESRAFVDQHDDPPSMLANVEADLGSRRVYGIPARDWPGVSSRLSPPSSLLSPKYTYWTLHRESVTPPGPIIPAADLVVTRVAGELMVRSLSGAFEATLAETLGEYLGAAAVNSFRPVRGKHTPRIVIDRLVLTRESWTFRVDELSWAGITAEADRFLGARAWRARHGLPERVFYRVPGEDKPTFVDFGSLVYVNILAKGVRGAMQVRDGTVTLTELLPDLPELWLRDATGARYTSELRMLALDGAEPARTPR